jgi:IS4 transposase
MEKFSSKLLMGEDLLKELDVLSIKYLDSSTITLKDNARKRFAGTGSKAGIKWHASFNALSGVMEWFKLTPSRTHDRKCFPDLASLKNTLIIFDLGYFDFTLLLDIKEIGGFFLSRLKSNSVVYITEVVQGFSRKAVGKSLLSIKFKLKKEPVVEVLIKKVCGERILECRAIGFWNPVENKYHWYLTNLTVAAYIIYPLYRIRWQIELIFKACKNSLNANQIPSSNTNIIESLLLASIASYLSTYTILDNALPYLDQQQKQAISFQRIAKTAVLLRQEFIDFLLSTSKDAINKLLKLITLFSNEIFDPNYKRRKTSMWTM